ncbi:MAG: hypothetical protein HRT88_12585, partial [Lentisphaeraceae bacterium]|nr:hypothetical protein [Lentisphaeraceae bacterium]
FGGEPIFIGSGYRHSPAGHFVSDYNHTRGQNAIVPDGYCQANYYSTGYGWIPRYVHGEKYTYFVGSAPKAFNGEHYPGPNAQKRKFITKENGYGKLNLTRYRRHMLVIRPNILIIYDELAAKDAHDWRYKLHSPFTMKHIKGNHIETGNNHCSTSTHFYASDDFNIDITNKFKQSATNLRGKEVNAKFDDVSHLTLSQNKKSKKFRYLTIIQIGPNDNSYEVFKPKRTDENKIKLGDYQIECELNVNKPSYLKVQKKDKNFIFSTGQQSDFIMVNGKRIKGDLPGTTLFYEKGSKGDIIKMEADTLPAAIKYDNIYR